MSEPLPSTWPSQDAWTGIAAVGRFGRTSGAPGVHLDLFDPVGLATIIVRADKDDALDGLVRDRFDLALPKPGEARSGASGTLVWSAPGQWLAVDEMGRGLADLPDHLSGVAAVTDQTDARAIVRISGPDARSALCKGVSIDLHPAAFQNGSSATTRVAHVTVQIWQTAKSPVFVLAVPRSFVGSLWSWLTASAAEFGYLVSQGPA